MVEIFEDLIPTTARHLMNRCREGMEDTFKGTAIHKLVPDLAAFGGLSRGYAIDCGIQLFHLDMGAQLFTHLQCQHPSCTSQRLGNYCIVHGKCSAVYV